MASRCRVATGPVLDVDSITPDLEAVWVDGAEWWATFDCAAEEHAHWTAFYTDSFAKWLESLRAHLAR